MFISIIQIKIVFASVAGGIFLKDFTRFFYKHKQIYFQP